ncbi:unnamed protein product [Didymodactylos carnosus]|uniref:Uncharacterized protein n=1 Tax=Didymodactylos carnosus TaxID=1234261 RepID=A0A814JUH8_9BILA|nr:unnamed protein product [Didymodactylos carnosus]CAF1042640.1 unnamed protein product [Didymodactylos carnosus]CAF3744750.1 unnamed protein product [Didymodactylos carnosus]CAF3812792.1 unnamed protein product [Didymodactylos carnosus]
MGQLVAFRLACYNYEGIDGVKYALRQGLLLSTEEISIKINLIASPLYVITCTCLDSDMGLNTLNRACEQIKCAIEQYTQGIYKIKMEPTIVTDVDEQIAPTEQEESDESDEENFEENDIILYDSDEEEI